MKTPPIQTENVNKASLVEKLRKTVASIGKRAALDALTLFHTARDPNTPIWCKTAALGSLGYFLSLIDTIPDLTPFLGYTDDVAVMAATLTTIALHITPETREKAEKNLQNLKLYS